MELLSILGISLFLTIALELCFGCLCRIRDRKDILLLILVNILTNPIVNISYYLVIHNNNWNRFIVVIVLELMAILTEGYYYRSYGRTFSRPFLFALCANLFSFGIGRLLNMIIYLFL